MYGIMTELVLYPLLALLGIILIYRTVKSKSFLRSIPGPKGIPFLGNAFQLDRVKPFIQLTEMAKLHGPIFKLNLIGKPVIVVSGYENLHEIFVTKGKDFAGRPSSFSLDYIAFIAGFDPNFHFYKKLFMTHVKIHGSGQKNSETIVCATIADLIEHIKSFNGSPVNIRKIMQHAIMDIIYQMAFKRKGTVEEKDFIINILQKIDTVLSGSAGADFYINLFPWLRFFGLPVWKKLKEIKEGQHEQYAKWKDEVISKREAGHNLEQNFLHKVLSIIEGDNIHGLTEEHSKSLTWSMFLGGMTTTAFLMMLLHVLIHRSDVQRKLYEEGRRVTKEHELTLSDRKDMPYHQAVFLETSRYFSILPFNIPHESMCSTELSGHAIPAGTRVWPNVWALHHDEDLWGDPYIFRPERYMDTDGCLVAADHPARTHNLVFGGGPRGCGGQIFALSRVFLILANLVKNFHILPATTLEEQPSCDCRNVVNGIVLFPPEYQARFQPQGK